MGQLEESIGLTTQEYALALIIFTLTFVVFEIPSNIMLKAATPRYWLAALLVACGILSSSQSFAGKGVHVIIIRALLGVFEAGVFPG